MTHTKVSEKPGQKMISSMQLQNRMKRSPNGLKGERKLGNSRVQSEEIQHILFVATCWYVILLIYGLPAPMLCVCLFSPTFYLFYASLSVTILPKCVYVLFCCHTITTGEAIDWLLSLKLVVITI